MRVAGVILAGGLGRRIGGGKAFRAFAGRTLIARVIDRLEPQVEPLALNVNDDPAGYAAFGLPLIADDAAGGEGPLAGILAALDWGGRLQPPADFVVTAPIDTPFLPPDLVQSLLAGREAAEADLAVARSAGRIHPVIALARPQLAAQLRRVLVIDGVRKVETWLGRLNAAAVDFPDHPFDPFFNVNSPADLATATEMECSGLA